MNKRILKGIALLCAVLFLLTAAVGCKKEEAEAAAEEEGLEVGGRARLGYAMEGITAIDNQSAFDKAVEEAFNVGDGISLDYLPVSLSSNGIDFSCRFANPPENGHDMYIQIYGDDANNDELYMSQLIPPGMVLSSITLNHALNPGEHSAICAFTLIDTAENGDQSVYKQISINITLKVEPEG